MKYNIIKGINIGLLLLVSSMLTLKLANNIEGTIKLFNYFIPILIGYIIIGLTFQWLREKPSRNNDGNSGIAIYYWIWIIMIIIPVLGVFISDYIRYIILVNVLVIAALWVFDYIQLSTIAKELNGEGCRKHKTLVIDLKEKPKTREEFFRLIEDQFIINGDTLEYIEREEPAIIKVNNVMYKAKIGYYYALAGNIVYTLKITEI